MSQTPVTRTVVVTNPSGLHARAAILVAKLVRQFQSRVELIKDHQRVEGTDVLQLLSLGADPGAQLVLEATGHDAEQALDALVQLFSSNFGEPWPS